MEIRKNKHGKYQCPCCGYYTFTDRVDNTFQLCPVCFWEDDGIQLHDPSYENGANGINLNQARYNFQKFGVMDLRFREYVRPPLQEELE